MKTDSPKERVESIPSGSFGIDIQNYGDESDLIYTIDISDLNPNDIEGERLITRKLGKGSYSITSIQKYKHSTIVNLIKIK